MSFRLSLFGILLLMNMFAYVALWKAVIAWIDSPARQRKLMYGISVMVFLLNVPLLAFFIRRADRTLDRVSLSVLEIFFYPAAAWLMTVIVFFVIVAPPAFLWGSVKAIAHILGKVRKGTSGEPAELAPRLPALSRRRFLAGSAGLLIPGIYGVAAYGAYGTMGEIDVSPEQSIPIPHLPRSLEGLTVVQVSDLHVGPYIREKELRHMVHLINQLRPDLVVITGDMIDRHLSAMPDAVRGLQGLRASLGVFAVLGNHDIYSDPSSVSGPHRGGVKIASGLETIGIRTLRNEVVSLGSGQDRLALIGLDWLNSDTTSPYFYRYQPVGTRRELHRMAQEAGVEAPKILLAHHPDTFADAIPFGIGLTLAGHTHGGGQVLLGTVNGVPIGIGMLRFKYLSGLYQERGCSLYVNRGIGYLGVPIRLNCPPEISRFKLIHPALS
ncbi:MAG: metallophosphoesterase [Acidobacteria bacterium]|nr:metallophosphoesterase [Acidobacteriota bacterium]